MTGRGERSQGQLGEELRRNSLRHSLALTEKSTRKTAKIATEMAIALPMPFSGSAKTPAIDRAQPRSTMAMMVMAQPATMNGLRRPKRDLERLMRGKLDRAS